MYKKKLGVRVITAITVGALLSSNMSVAMANTQIATLEDNLDEKTADEEKNVEEEETETVDETVEETETEEAEEEESTDEIEESDSEEEVTGDEEDTVETEEEETPVEEKTEEETDKEEEAPAETDDPSGASDDAEELPAEETEEETDTAEEGVPEENTDAKEEVSAKDENLNEEIDSEMEKENSGSTNFIQKSSLNYREITNRSAEEITVTIAILDENLDEIGRETVEVAAESGLSVKTNQEWLDISGIDIEGYELDSPNASYTASDGDEVSLYVTKKEEEPEQKITVTIAILDENLDEIGRKTVEVAAESGLSVKTNQEWLDISGIDIEGYELDSPNASYTASDGDEVSLYVTKKEEEPEQKITVTIAILDENLDEIGRKTVEVAAESGLSVKTNQEWLDISGIDIEGYELDSPNASYTASDGDEVSLYVTKKEEEPEQKITVTIAILDENLDEIGRKTVEVAAESGLSVKTNQEWLDISGIDIEGYELDSPNASYTASDGDEVSLYVTKKEEEPEQKITVTIAILDENLDEIGRETVEVAAESGLSVKTNQEWLDISGIDIEGYELDSPNASYTASDGDEVSLYVTKKEEEPEQKITVTIAILDENLDEIGRKTVEVAAESGLSVKTNQEWLDISGIDIEGYELDSPNASYTASDGDEVSLYVTKKEEEPEQKITVTIAILDENLDEIGRKTVEVAAESGLSVKTNQEWLDISGIDIEGYELDSPNASYTASDGDEVSLYVTKKEEEPEQKITVTIAILDENLDEIGRKTVEVAAESGLSVKTNQEWLDISGIDIEGYELDSPNASYTASDGDEVSLYVTKKEEEPEQKITVTIAILDENLDEIGRKTVEVAAESGLSVKTNQEWLDISGIDIEGYELDSPNASYTASDGDEVSLYVTKKEEEPEQKITVTIAILDENLDEIGRKTVEVAAESGLSVKTNQEWLDISGIDIEGYELDSPNASYTASDGDEVSLYVTKKEEEPEQKITVTIAILDENLDEIGRKTVEVAAESGLSVKTNQEWLDISGIDIEGYELDSPNASYTASDGDEVSLYVTKKEEEPEQKITVTIAILDENLDEIGRKTVEVAAESGLSVKTNQEWLDISGIDIEGYELDSPNASYTASDGDEVSLYVTKKEDPDTDIIMNVQFYEDTEDNVIAGGDYFVPAGVQNYSVLDQYVPEGYKIAVSGDFFAEEGATLKVRVEKDETEEPTEDIIMNIQFYEDTEDNVIAGGDYFVPAGVQNYSVLDQYVPEGYKIAVSGDFFAEEGATLKVRVEKDETEEPTEDIIMNIQFYEDTEDNVIAGGDYFVPAGVQNYSVLDQYVPEGYKIAVSGDFFAEEGATLKVRVEKDETEEPTEDIIMNIQFYEDTEDNVIAGGDYFVPAGVQNYSVLDQYVPEGYKIAVSGDFFAEEGAKLKVRVEKIQPTIINVVFTDAQGNNVGGGDYFVDEDGDGIFNYSELDVPEGYKLVVTGDAFVSDFVGKTTELKVVRDGAAIINVTFTDAQGNNVGGGDYFVDEDGDGIFNYSELDVPEGYKLVETGDAFVSDFVGKTTELKVVRDGAAIINVTFTDAQGNNVGGGDYFVDEDGDGIFNYSELDVPEGYKLVVTGDAFVNDFVGKTTELKVVRDGAAIINVTFTDAQGNNVGGGDYFVDEDGDGIFNYSELDVPEGYKLVVTGDAFVNDFVGKTTELKVVRDGAAIINAQFVDEDGNVIAGGDYFVDEDGDGIFNYSELAEYVPEGYTMQTLGDAFVAEGTFIINISKDNEEPETKNVTITYVDENGKIVGTQTIEVPAGDNNINTSKLTVPEGFELVWTGDLAIEDGAVTVEVKATENPDNPDNPDPEDPDNPDNPDPEDPDNPDNPDNPDPDQPDNPNQGGSGSGSSGGSSGGSGGGSGSATGSHALRSGEWILDDIGWWYQYSDNTYAKAGWYSLVWRGNTDWYYFNEAGYLISGWFEQNGNRYFLHDVHDGTFGRMYTGWNQVEGQWYFFNDNADNGTVGALVEGAQVPAELLNQ